MTLIQFCSVINYGIISNIAGIRRFLLMWVKIYSQWNFRARCLNYVSDGKIRESKNDRKARSRSRCFPNLFNLLRYCHFLKFGLAPAQLFKFFVLKILPFLPFSIFSGINFELGIWQIKTKRPNTPNFTFIRVFLSKIYLSK